MCTCPLPVSLEVFEASFQVIQQVDLFAALRTVYVHQFTGVMVTYLMRSLPCTVNIHKETYTIKYTQIDLTICCKQNTYKRPFIECSLYSEIHFPFSSLCCCVFGVDIITKSVAKIKKGLTVQVWPSDALLHFVVFTVVRDSLYSLPTESQHS